MISNRNKGQTANTSSISDGVTGKGADKSD